MRGIQPDQTETTRGWIDKLRSLNTTASSRSLAQIMFSSSARSLITLVIIINGISTTNTGNPTPSDLMNHVLASAKCWLTRGLRFRRAARLDEAIQLRNETFAVSRSSSRIDILPVRDSSAPHLSVITRHPVLR